MSRPRPPSVARRQRGGARACDTGYAGPALPVKALAVPGFRAAVVAAVTLPRRVPTLAGAAQIGTLPHGSGILARDLAVSCSDGSTIRWFFGDPFGGINADGTLQSNNGATSSVATPFVLTNFAGDQVIPYSAAEATYNLEAHADRWGLYPFHAFRDGGGTRLIYTLTKPTGGSGGGAFYDSFPHVAIGTAVLTDGATQIVRANEVALTATYWPVGFRTTGDGVLRFWMQHSVDADAQHPFFPAQWTSAGGFVVSGSAAFTLDSAIGITVFFNRYQQSWLAAWIDSRGWLRLGALTEQGQLEGPSHTLLQIGTWNREWDGYMAIHVDGTDSADGRVFFLCFAKTVSVLSNIIAIVRVQIA